MTFSLSLFGFFPKESPIHDLVKHYNLIEEGSKIVPEAFLSYTDSRKHKQFTTQKESIDAIEDRADKEKRRIRNHMPRGLFMPVDRTIFFNFTRSLDDILDHAQDAMNWLAINKVKIPAPLKAEVNAYLSEILKSVTMLRPALEATIELVGGGTFDRDEAKTLCRNIVSHHDKVGAQKRAIIATIYNSSMPFKDVYQLLKFIEEMYESSHNTERCSDMLRAMLAK